MNPINSFRKYILNRNIKKMVKAIESRALDVFLELILRIVSLVLRIDKDYRRNIENFDARYAFKSKDGKIAASAIFKDNKMKIRNSEIKDTDITVIFKDGKALRGFLFTENPDIIGAILDTEVSYIGNLNYLSKFAYMAKNLQLRFSL